MSSRNPKTKMFYEEIFPSSIWVRKIYNCPSSISPPFLSWCLSLILGRLFLVGEVSRGQAKFQEPCVLRIVFHFGPPDMEVTVPHSRGTDSPTT